MCHLYSDWSSFCCLCRVVEDDMDFYIPDLEFRDLNHLWLYDGICLFTEQMSLDVNWGIF